MQYVIVGGVGGGATVAARLRRMDENATIILFEKGKYISYANCGLPYYIGGTIAERNNLFLQTPTTFGNRFDVDVRVHSEVTDINRKEKTITYNQLDSGKTFTVTYDKLVLSPGTTAVRPTIPGIDSPNIFTLKDVNDTDNIKVHLENLANPTNKTAVVIGAGFIGLETAENLHKLGMKVIIVEKAAHVMPTMDAEIAMTVQQHLLENGVELYTSNSVVSFCEEENHTKITLEDNVTLAADFVLMSVGVRPLTKLAQNAGIEIGTTGGIVVNEYMQTNDTDIYAVGDAVETTHPLTHEKQLCFLAGPTNKQARIAANNIVLGNQQKYAGTMATAIAKVFDMTIGCTGLSEKQLKKLQIPYITSITHTASHATYYPGNYPISIKIQFDQKTGRLLGASAVGKEGTDKRIDVLATTIAHGGTIYDLTDFDHAYAPPFSSPKDPVTNAGYVAQNILEKRVFPIQWHELREMLAHKAEKDFLLIDVRSIMENRAGTIEGSVNYPLDELREYLEDIPTDQTIVIFCAIGLRGYIASRILLQAGFEKVYNLAGGIKTYNVCKQLTK